MFAGIFFILSIVKTASSQVVIGTPEFSIVIGGAAYDDCGYDRYGYDRYGYDRDGYNREGWNREGYDRDGDYRWRDRDDRGFYNRDNDRKDNYDRDDNYRRNHENPGKRMYDYKNEKRSDRTSTNER